MSLAMRALARLLTVSVLAIAAYGRAEDRSLPTRSLVDPSIAEICAPRGPVDCWGLLARASEWVQQFAPRGKETAFKNSGTGAWDRVEIVLMHSRADSEFLRDFFGFPVIASPIFGPRVADGLTVAGEDRARSTRVIHVALLWDQVTEFNRGHTVSDGVIFARLITILAHEFFGNVQTFVNQDLAAYRQWSTTEKISTEIFAYRGGIKFLKRVLARKADLEGLTTREDLEATLKKDQADLAEWLKARAQRTRCEEATLRLLPSPKKPAKMQARRRPKGRPQ